MRASTRSTDARRRRGSPSRSACRRDLKAIPGHVVLVPADQLADELFGRAPDPPSWLTPAVATRRPSGLNATAASRRLPKHARGAARAVEHTGDPSAPRLPHSPRMVEAADVSGAPCVKDWRSLRRPRPRRADPRPAPVRREERPVPHLRTSAALAGWGMMRTEPSSAARHAAHRRAPTLAILPSGATATARPALAGGRRDRGSDRPPGFLTPGRAVVAGGDDAAPVSCEHRIEDFAPVAEQHGRARESVPPPDARGSISRRRHDGGAVRAELDADDLVRMRAQEREERAGVGPEDRPPLSAFAAGSAPFGDQATSSTSPRCGACPPRAVPGVPDHGQVVGPRSRDTPPAEDRGQDLLGWSSTSGARSCGIEEPHVARPRLSGSSVPEELKRDALDTGMRQPRHGFRQRRATPGPPPRRGGDEPAVGRDREVTDRGAVGPTGEPVAGADVPPSDEPVGVARDDGSRPARRPRPRAWRRAAGRSRARPRPVVSQFALAASAPPTSTSVPSAVVRARGPCVPARRGRRRSTRGRLDRGRPAAARQHPAGPHIHQRVAQGVLEPWRRCLQCAPRGEVQALLGVDVEQGDGFGDERAALLGSLRDRTPLRRSSRFFPSSRGRRSWHDRLVLDSTAAFFCPGLGGRQALGVRARVVGDDPKPSLLVAPLLPRSRLPACLPSPERLRRPAPLFCRSPRPWLLCSRPAPSARSASKQPWPPGQ